MHNAEKIAKLKATIAKLEAAHKTETKDFKKVAKAHKAEGKKVAAKNMGKAGRAKLQALHEAETDALEMLLGSHMDEGDKIKSVKKAVPRMKGAPTTVMMTPEVSPMIAEAAAAPARGRGRPKGSLNKPKDTAAKSEPVPRMKLIKVTPAGMAGSELAGKAPDSGPQATAADQGDFMKKPKRAPRAKKTTPDIGDFMEGKLMKKPRAPRAKKPVMEIKEVEIVAPAMPGEPMTAPAVPAMKKERKKRAPMTPEQRERAIANLAKARAAKKDKTPAAKKDKTPAAKKVKEAVAEVVEMAAGEPQPVTAKEYAQRLKMEQAALKKKFKDMKPRDRAKMAVDLMADKYYVKF
jgi:hypothetical protein